jgi:hypothetical protein
MTGSERSTTCTATAQVSFRLPLEYQNLHGLIFMNFSPQAFSSKNSTSCFLEGKEVKPSLFVIYPIIRQSLSNTQKVFWWLPSLAIMQGVKFIFTPPMIIKFEEDPFLAWSRLAVCGLLYSGLCG